MRASAKRTLPRRSERLAATRAQLREESKVTVVTPEWPKRQGTCSAPIWPRTSGGSAEKATAAIRTEPSVLSAGTLLPSLVLLVPPLPISIKPLPSLPNRKSPLVSAMSRPIVPWSPLCTNVILSSRTQSPQRASGYSKRLP